MKLETKILDVVEYIDPNFVNDMKSSERYLSLTQMSNIFLGFMVMQIKNKLGLIWKNIDKSFASSIKYIIKLKEEKIQTPYANILTSNNSDRILIIFGSIYLSSDGEYRANVFNISNPIQLIDISKKIRENKLIMEYMDAIMNICKIKIISSNKKLSESLSNIGLPEILLTICVYAMSKGTLASNTLPEYVEILRILVREIQSLELDSEARNIIKEIYKFTYSSKIGIKLIPISDKEMESEGLITKKCWRELYITEELSNLSINGISYNFPYIFSWLYVDKYEYDNPLIKSKVQSSSDVNNIKKKLEELYDSSKDKYADLPEYLDMSIKYIDNNLIFSNNSIAMLLSYSGFPLTSLKNMDIPLLNSNIDSLLFQYSYSLLCMNKIGIIHNDLHSNNAVFTIYINKMGNDFNIYHINDIYYYVPTYGIHCGIIDFSRSFLSINASREIEKINIQNDIAKIFNISIKNSYKYYLSEYYNSHKEHINFVINKFPDIAFKLFTAFDMYRLSTSAIESLKDSKYSLNTLADIRLMMLDFLTDKMDEVGKTLFDTLFEYPNKMILDYFDFKSEIDGVLMFYNNFNNTPKKENPFTSSLEEYCTLMKVHASTWPFEPLLSQIKDLCKK